MRVIEMNFLPDVYVHCEKCNGKRYNRETLEIRYKGKSISDVLDMTVDEAVEFFQNVPYLYRKIKVLEEVGLGYFNNLVYVFQSFYGLILQRLRA